VIPLAAYCLAYSLLCRERSAQATLGASCAVYFLVSAFLSFVPASPLVALVGAVASILSALKVMPRGTRAAGSRRMPSWEIPARMVAATLLVVVITEGANFLGPRWSGLIAPFPIYATVFSVFMQKFDGPDACASFLRGVVMAALAASAFFFTFSLTVNEWGLISAALASLFATVLVEASMLVLRKASRT
jgi:hypothetical protein